MNQYWLKKLYGRLEITNGKWKGSYTIENGFEKVEFETKIDLLVSKHVDFYVVNKYVKSGEIVKQGNLKGYKIFHNKLKEV